MKKLYTTPKCTLENFIPNTYVSVCNNYKAKLYCAIPGNSKSYVNDGSTTVWGQDGLQHGGPCASGSTVTFFENGQTQGMEDATGHQIYSLSVGSEASLSSKCSTSVGTAPDKLEVNHYYKCYWENQDGAGLEYKHYGLMNILSESYESNRS